MPRVTSMTHAGFVPGPTIVGPDRAGPDDAWADTLARLARAHRARLAAPDPSRPWLSTATRRLIPEDLDRP